MSAPQPSLTQKKQLLLQLIDDLIDGLPDEVFPKYEALIRAFMADREGSTSALVPSLVMMNKTVCISGNNCDDLERGSEHKRKDFGCLGTAPAATVLELMMSHGFGFNEAPARVLLSLCTYDDVFMAKRTSAGWNYSVNLWMRQWLSRVVDRVWACPAGAMHHELTFGAGGQAAVGLAARRTDKRIDRAVGECTKYHDFDHVGGWEAASGTAVYRVLVTQGATSKTLKTFYIAAARHPSKIGRGMAMAFAEMFGAYARNGFMGYTTGELELRMPDGWTPPAQPRVPTGSKTPDKAWYAAQGPPYFAGAVQSQRPHAAGSSSGDPQVSGADAEVAAGPQTRARKRGQGQS